MGLTGTVPSVRVRTASYSKYCWEEDKGQATLRGPSSSLWSLGKSQQSDLFFSSPVSLLLSTPTLLNRFISITKEK